MKKQAVSETKYAMKPASIGRAITSLVFKTQVEQDAAYAPKVIPRIGRAATKPAAPTARPSKTRDVPAVRDGKDAATKPAARAAAAFEEPVKALAGDDELRLHGFKAGKKGLCAVCFKTMDDGPHVTEELPRPKGKPKAALHPVAAMLEAARFRYARTESIGQRTAHGYVHANGCGAVYIEDAHGEGESWTVRDPAGTESSGKAADLDALNAALERPAKKAPIEPTAERLAELADKAAKKRAPVPSLAELASAPKPPQGPPANVLRAVEMLGGLTTMRFDLDMLKGDKNYGRRMKLMKVLLAKDKVLVAETGLGAMAKAFHAAVGADAHPHPKTRAAEFAAKCKDIAALARKIKADAKTAEKESIRRGKLGADFDKRFVAGKILDAPPKKLSKAERKAIDDSIIEDVLSFSVTTERIAVPNPDAVVDLQPGDIGLLRDPDNGIVMMQLERENSQGAIAIYNNCTRVAAGVVPLATLKKLRPVSGEIDIVLAAQQLLNPPDGLPVTSSAARHLTAVIDCKEFSTMATKKAAKKFDAPKSALTKETTKTAKKAAKKSEAAAPRKACTYRLINNAKKTWEAFGGQKGDIVKVLVKSGAVGAKATGLTAAAITEATGIASANVAFYVSKLQKTDPAVLEKLPAV